MFNPDFSHAVTVIDSSTGKNGTVFEVVEYIRPRNSISYGSVGLAQSDGQKLRQVRISLKDGGVLVQPRALQFMKGPIHVDVLKNASGKGFFKSLGTGEASFTSRYSGKYGEIYLEPSYKYFYVIELQNEAIIVDDGMFYCCEDSIALSVHTNSFTAGAVSGDGMRQPKLSGSGIAILESEVPFEEVLIYELHNDTLKIDGNFSIVIRGNLETQVEKSKSEGYLHTLKGTGEVWLAPAKKHRPLNI